jgi:hypothetical protein
LRHAAAPTGAIAGADTRQGHAAFSLEMLSSIKLLVLCVLSWKQRKEQFLLPFLGIG